MKVSDWSIAPMEPVSGQEAFDSRDMLCQVKWDGVRYTAGGVMRAPSILGLGIK